MPRGPEAQLCETYLQRSRPFAKQAGLEGPHLREHDRPLHGLTGTIIACDERGDLLTSREFARLLDPGTASGALHLAIGPADGWSDVDRSACTRLISFGRMSLPHLLLRVVLCEQIYRALTILNGHPYHRD